MTDEGQTATADCHMPGRRVLLLLLCLALSAAAPFAMADPNSLPLSSKARAWIETHPVITFAAHCNNPPIEYFDTDGRYRGIVADFLGLLEKRLGIGINIVRLRDRDAQGHEACEANADLFAVEPGTALLSDGLLLTTALAEFPSAIIVPEGTGDSVTLEALSGRKISVVKGSLDHKHLMGHDPPLNLDPVPSTAEALRRVSCGISDAFVANPATASYYIERDGINYLRMAGNTGCIHGVVFAVNSSRPELAAVLEEGLSRITSAERATILGKQPWFDGEHTAAGHFRTDTPVVLTLAFLLALGLLVWNISLNAAVSRKTRELGVELNERRRIEDALRASQEQYSSIFENSTDGILLTNSDQRILAANPAACRILGRTQEDLAELELTALTESSNVTLRRFIEERARNGTAAAELTLRRGEASDSPVEMSSTIFPDKDGRLRAIVIIRDIRERKKAEAALSSAHQRFQDIIEFLPDATFVIDRKKRVIAWNRAIEEMTGVKEADILGKADYSYSLPFYGEPRPILVDMVADGDLGVAELYDYISRKGETVYGEAFAPMTYEGKGAYLSGTASSLLDKHGEIIGAIQSIRDVSGRKQAEEELRLSEEALRESETQLRFLSSKLLTAQEEERKRIARELHDSIGQYLVAIKFSLESALADPAAQESASLKEKLNVLIPLAQNAVEESRRICNGLRPSILDDMGIVSTLRWLCREFRRTCPAIYLSERLMTAENDIPEPLKIVIFRIAQEAINNAAKYSRADHVDLWLSRTGNEIELIVEDSGVGFDVTEALSRTPDARGLGLTGMRERTEFSGGSFSIRSAADRGTTVYASWHLDT